jgi:hypothetical protein
MTSLSLLYCINWQVHCNTVLYGMQGRICAKKGGGVNQKSQVGQKNLTSGGRGGGRMWPPTKSQVGPKNLTSGGTGPKWGVGRPTSHLFFSGGSGGSCSSLWWVEPPNHPVKSDPDGKRKACGWMCSIEAAVDAAQSSFM